MSQIPRDIALAERGPDDDSDLLPTPRDQAPQGNSTPSDDSGALFDMYLEEAAENDKKMVRDWKNNTNGILVFTGLFSAVVAALLALSAPTIQRNPQDTSSFYLAHIYQQLSTQSNGSQPSIPSGLTNPIEPFIPPTSGVWVNGLWFMSLVITLTCATTALLIQQSACHYLRVAYPHRSLHRRARERARIREFFRDGVKDLNVPRTIEVLLALLQISVCLFFVGLSVYLFSAHRTIFAVVTTWIGVCISLYAYVSLLLTIHKNSPYYSPLSSLFFFCRTSIRYVFFYLLQRFKRIAFICMPLRSRGPRAVHLDNFSSHNMTKTAEQYALKLDPNIEYRSLLWTFQSLEKDSDLEKFFEGLPRLFESETGKSLNLQQGFIIPNKERLSNALIEMINRTLSSDLASEFVIQRRLIICTKAIESTSLVGPWWILRRVLLGGWHQFLGCIEFGLFVQNWKNIAHPVTLFYRQCVAALTISIVRDHDERWPQLASGLLDVSKTLFDNYIANGASILLANAILIVRRTVQTYSGSAERHREDIIGASSKTLETVCKLDIQRTLPELQHEFCGLWNQLVAAAQSDPTPHHGFVATTTLKNIWKLYIALHECPRTPPTAFYTTTSNRDPILNNPKSYPMCMIDDHRPSDPIPDLQFDDPPEFGGYPPFPIPIPISTPDLIYPCPPGPSTLPTPFPTTPYHPSSTPPHYGPHFEVTYPHFSAPPDAAVPFPQPQLTHSHTPNVHTPNVQPGVIVRSPPSPPPRIPTSLVPPVYLDNGSTTSDPSGGHGQCSQPP